MFSTNQDKSYTFLYEYLVKKHTGNFSFMLSEEFWEFWFEMEIDERQNADTEAADLHFIILLEMAQMMINFNLSEKHVNFTIQKLQNKVSMNVEACRDLDKVIAQQRNIKNKNRNDM